MKQCPICQALAFDDAETCFGCMHDFNADFAVAKHGLIPPADFAVEGESFRELSALDPNAQKAVKAAPSLEAPPAFVIRIKPERERSGLTSWTCSVDLMPA